MSCSTSEVLLICVPADSEQVCQQDLFDRHRGTTRGCAVPMRSPKPSLDMAIVDKAAAKAEPVVTMLYIISRAQDEKQKRTIPAHRASIMSERGSRQVVRHMLFVPNVGVLAI